MESARIMTGTWRCAYRVGHMPRMEQHDEVLTLNLEQGSHGAFRGISVDGAGTGATEIPVIQGRIEYPRVEFEMRESILRVPGIEIVIKTTESLLARSGRSLEANVPQTVLRFTGRFVARGAIEGQWTMAAFQLAISDGSVLKMQEMIGTWNMTAL